MTFLPHSIRKKGGFTLMEIMIVITMMMILSSIGMIPYGYYMDRAQVEKTLDMVSQEWILSHNSVRNGILYDTSKHADLYIKFESGAKNIEILLASGSTFSTTEKKNYKILSLESKIEILTFSGITENLIYYHIAPPYATGAYIDEDGTIINSTGIIMTIGYPGASLESGRARNILLKPYYN